MTTGTYQWPLGLNPYYSGRGFLSYVKTSLLNSIKDVLILIILEEGSSGYQKRANKGGGTKVLILIILEEGSSDAGISGYAEISDGLNPYYSGRGFLSFLL